jgi:outer membrane protein assembly factor BamB/predicted Ser/Thr protein kinase
MSDARIGSEIAGYRIVSLLGQGGMGTVYVAEQTSPRRKVVLKLLRHDLSEDDAFRRRFIHESEAAASTEHPNIVPIYSSGEADGVLYIAMRYVEGEDLRHRLAREGRVPADRAVEIVSQVASALDAAHRRGLVHRDVKPGNILLDEHGNGYLTDFGLIKRSEVSTGITKTGQFMGSIEYCAPEQIRGEEVDGRADVYSLGCVLFECLAGQPPFKRDTEIATLYAHLEQRPPQLPASASASKELDRVLAKAMTKRSSERYPTAGEFARAARRALGVTSGERETVPRRDRRWGVVFGVLIAIGVTVGAIALFARDGSSGDGADGTNTGSTAAGHSVVRLDPETGNVVQTVGGLSVRLEPYFTNGLAVGEGGVWVGSVPNVVHVDPITGTIRATISVAGRPGVGGITLPAVAFRTVWVSTGPILERINPATDELLPPISLVPQEATSPGRTWIATGEERVWVAGPTLVVEVDPIGGLVVRRIDVTGVTGLAVGEGSVWVIDDLSGQLLRLDPATGRQVGSAAVPGSLDDVTAGGGVVWILDKGAGTVVLVDPATLEVTDTIRVGSDERDLEFGGDAVWLADGDQSSLTRIDPLTLRVSTFPVGGTARLVAVGPAPEDVWGLIGSPG